MLRDVVLAAAVAALPPGLLARLRLAGAPARRAAGEGKQGAQRHSALRGRPIGARPGALRQGGARLSLVETLRAAAPWQGLRRAAGAGARPRVIVRKEDVRIRRFRERVGSVAIFVVDASGSAALQRLAEAKGAVETLLADCYVRRDQVALIAFRGTGAELLLPPTGSLVRARRCLAGLPGGGGTPLAAALDAARALAQQVRRKGRTPLAVLLTDGRANVARDGTGGRARAEEEALAAARLARAEGLTALVVDTAPRPQPQARAIAGAMAARYLPLPQADGRVLSQAARALAGP
jgi:magnesium chelatase subunit D